MNTSPLPDWRGHTCVIAASGPSLTPEQCFAAVTSKAKVIAINTTFRMLPEADALYACDYLWLKIHKAQFMPAFNGRVWTQDRAAAEQFNLKYVRHAARDGLGRGNTLHVGGNSGHGAINLAYLFGARRILLIGYDMREIGGKKHWHPDHPAPCVQKQQFGEWIHKFRKLAEDLKAAQCEVINCTPKSALQCFPMGDMEQELAK